MTPILIVPPRSYPEQTPVHAAWLRRGWHVHRVSSFREPLSVPRERARLYGDYEFCVRVAHALRLELVSPSDDLLVTLTPEFVRREVWGCELGDLQAQRFPLFVKPLAPKLFPAAVYASWKKLCRHTEGLLATTPVFASEPVSLDSEVRCLVLEGEVLSCSVYEGAGSVREAHLFAQSFAERHKVALTYTLDVGAIPGRGWAVIEANAIWGAGLNGCDPEAMADCVSAATRVPIKQV